jgi:PAS domain S-box-containing protein
LKAGTGREINNWIDGLKSIDREFKQIKYELNETEALHRTILSNISDAVFITDNKGAFTYVHPGMFDLFSIRPDEIGKTGNIEHLMGKDFFNFENLKNSGEIRNLEHEIVDRNGRKLILLVNIKKVSINSGTLLFTCRDITAQRHIEKKIDAINKILRDNSFSIANLSGRKDGIGPLDFICNSLVEICGYTCAWIVLVDRSGNPRFFNQSGLDDEFPNVWRMPERGKFSELIKKAIAKTDDGKTADLFLNEHDGGIAPDCMDHDFLTTRLEYDGSVYGLLAVSIRTRRYHLVDESNLLLELGKNVSYALYNAELKDKQRKTEEKVRAYQDLLRSMASKITLAEERERHRIAVELHDGIGQNLAIAKIKLNTLEESSKVKESLCLIKEIRGIIDQTISSMRSLTFELSPPILYEFGLEAALEWLSENISNQHGIQVKHVNDGKPKPVTEQLQVLIFQMVRELLLNVVKHAQAGSVNLHVTKKNRNLQIQVEDNGKGFNYPGSKLGFSRSGGFGLFSIRERLDCFGGKFEVKTKPGHGTRVIIKVPLKQKHNKLQLDKALQNHINLKTGYG